MTVMVDKICYSNVLYILWMQEAIFVKAGKTRDSQTRSRKEYIALPCPSTWIIN